MATEQEAARAVVIGGGIGGLTAAVALHQSGWRVTVLERAASLAPVGAAISLAPNALRALDVIGAGDEIRALAAWQGDGGLRTPTGRWISRANASDVAARFGDPLVLLRRADLVDRLAARLPPGSVRTGCAAELLDPGGTRAPARVGTPEGELAADLVVGADGIRSAVRSRLFPAHPGTAYSGLTTWRIMVPAPERPFAPHETWGRGRLWGSQPLKDGTVYAYAAALLPAGTPAPDGEKHELALRFGTWHHPVPALIGSAPDEGVLRHDVHQMAAPLPAFHLGRVALVGDAAHAMQPTLGQGGNQAIEDAVVLAHHAGPGGASGPPRLAGYTADRLPRTTALARRAVGAGRLALLRNPAAIALRNTAVALASKAGPGLFLRGFVGVADWVPPQSGAVDVSRGR